jgi:hypothetical protein
MTGNKWWAESPFKEIIGEVAKGRGTQEFTGVGPDGKVNPQRQAPVGIMNTAQGSKMLHEGEVKMTTDDGRFAVIPSHVLPSTVLKMMEDQSKMGGFASGGTGQTLLGVNLNLPNIPNPSNTVKKTAVNPIIQDGGSPGTLSPIGTPPPNPTLANSGTSTQVEPLLQPIPMLSSSTGTSTTAGQPAGPQSDIDLSTSIIRDYAKGKPSAAANQAMQNQGASAAAEEIRTQLRDKTSPLFE